MSKLKIVVVVSIVSVGAVFVSRPKAQDTKVSCADLMREYGRQLKDDAASQRGLSRDLEFKSGRVDMGCEFDRPGIKSFLSESSRTVDRYAGTSERIAEFLLNANCQ